jgi:hypothetical protein
LCYRWKNLNWLKCFSFIIPPQLIMVLFRFIIFCTDVEIIIACTYWCHEINTILLLYLFQFFDSILIINLNYTMKILTIFRIWRLKCRFLFLRRISIVRHRRSLRPTWSVCRTRSRWPRISSTGETLTLSSTLRWILYIKIYLFFLFYHSWICLSIL